MQTGLEIQTGLKEMHKLVIRLESEGLNRFEIMNKVGELHDKLVLEGRALVPDFVFIRVMGIPTIYKNGFGMIYFVRNGVKRCVSKDDYFTIGRIAKEYDLALKYDEENNIFFLNQSKNQRRKLRGRTIAAVNYYTVVISNPAYEKSDALAKDLVSTVETLTGGNLY